MILIIHPFDQSTKRLRRLASHLHRNIPNTRLFVVHPNEDSKILCHQVIQNCSSSDLIMYFGHGRSDALYGAKGKYYDALFPPDILAESDKNDFEYYDDSFIDRDTYRLFENKKVFCYGCNTARLARKLKDAGAKAVYGFGIVPTSKEEFSEFHIDQASNILVSSMKGSITRVLKHGVRVALKTAPKHTFADLYRILEYEFQREIERTLSSNFRFKQDLANTLHRVKNEMRIIGDIKCKLH